ncbi:trem-like transcript 4 protein [Microtus ochrogaster]|uniref:Trem-like transcript 4 protein n=1 Tax=Microtus ochrogaster TaxID=79684 RepID=A0ABM0L6B4_MICOH|nr:trem-like transcript 4 protein [Microtus ochrogaster]
MAWRGSQLLLTPVLLLLHLASGVWGSTVVSEELHKTVGQNLYVKCQYKPEAGPYVPKSWCHQISSDRCKRVVTTSQTRRAETESQHAIWDYPEDGHFIITITRLTEKNSAIYWCGLFNVSHNKIRVLRNISLVVSPAVPTLPPRTSAGLRTRIVLTASPEETTGSFTHGCQHRNQSSPSSAGGVSPRLLVFVLCGLLLLKGLMLSVLCVVLSWRSCQGREYAAETGTMEITDYASLPDISESLGARSHISGYEKNAYSLNAAQ